MKNIDLWLKSAIESFFELKQIRKCDGVSQSFIVDWLFYTTKEKEWCDLSRSVQSRLIGKELSRLQNKKKIAKIDPQEYICSENLYYVL